MVGASFSASMCHDRELKNTAKGEGKGKEAGKRMEAWGTTPLSSGTVTVTMNSGRLIAAVLVSQGRTVPMGTIGTRR